MAVATRGESLREGLTGLRTAARLGWQIESNWTDPFLFALYSIIKPISASLILVFMWLVVIRGRAGGAEAGFFAYIYVGNAFYMYVYGVLFGISWAIIDDREHYEMLKYIYLSPIRIYTYLLGRGFARFIISTMAVIITLAFGVAVLKIPIYPAQIDYPFFLLSLFIGLGSIVCLGIILAGVCLITARHNWGISESVAGIFFLLCGVIYPLHVLPGWAQAIGKVLPPTYWLEAMRRAVLGPSISSFNTALSSISNGSLLAILLGTTVALAIVSHLFFKAAEHRARKRGLIDQRTNY